MKTHPRIFGGVLFMAVLFVFIRADGDGDFAVGAFGGDEFIAGTRCDHFGIGADAGGGVGIHETEEIILYRSGVHRGIGVVPA